MRKVYSSLIVQEESGWLDAMPAALVGGKGKGK
jgi:hypothetical protein